VEEREVEKKEEEEDDDDDDEVDDDEEEEERERGGWGGGGGERTMGTPLRRQIKPPHDVSHYCPNTCNTRMPARRRKGSNIECWSCPAV
jgi:hypothetical protein